MVEVRESYANYSPPADFRLATELLLHSVPPQFLAGLRCVVLRNAGGFGRREKKKKTRSRGRVVPLSRCRGLYYAQTPRRPATIVLFVDNIVLPWPQWMLRIRFFREVSLAQTLFHEIGHHIHHRISPEYREKEDVANRWKRELGRAYFRRRYWYIIPLMPPARFCLRWIQKIVKYLKRR
jgi:hypothetical protein